MKLHGFDLNLLKVFKTLWVERSVSRAASRLHLSQSATSAALSRLRRAFDDELFIWDGREMRTTPRAESLAPAVEDLLAEAGLLMEQASNGSTAVAREFVIASIDYIERMIGPALLAAVRTSAPNLTIDMVNATPEMFKRTGARSVDLFLLPEGLVPQGCVEPRLLYRDRYVGIVAKRHAGIMRHIGASACPRVLASPSHHGNVSANLPAAQSRLKTSHLDLIPRYVAGSNCIAFAPSYVAQWAMNGDDLETFELSNPAESLVLMYWQPAHEGDPLHRWLREAIIGIGEGVQRQLATRN